MNNSSKVRLFDVRAIERNIKQGLITRKDVATHHDSLPDVAAKGISLGEAEDRRAERASGRGEPPRPQS